MSACEIADGRHMIVFLLSLPPTILHPNGPLTGSRYLISYLRIRYDMYALTLAHPVAHQATSGMPLLVPELVDLIVDELRDDTSALRACSMAATVFRSRTRQYLFETIRLSNCSKTLYASFFSVLGSSEPAACVRKLDVRLFRHLDQVDYWSCAHGDQGLIPILGRLERLEELALEGLDWFALDDAQQAQLLAATMLPFLRTLRLRRVLLPGESFVVRLFTSHQRTLQTVEVGDLARGPSEVQASCLASTGVWLVDFLWESSMHWPLTFWLDAFVFSSLVTLDLRVDHDREIQAVQTLLHNVSATLNHLTFRQTAHPGELHSISFRQSEG
jgi:hypothetical protein